MSEDLQKQSMQVVAERAGEAMWRADTASQGLGMVLEAIGPGTAKISMKVRDDMLNGIGSCHGGFIFALADSAFAFACNSYNRRTVAQHCSITYVAPAAAGDTLTAEAREATRYGRNGIYDVSVHRGDGALAATFRGHSLELGGAHYEDEGQG